MDNQNQPLDEGLGANAELQAGLQITASIREYWRESTQWALFFAILGFLYLALLLLILLNGGPATAGIVAGLFMFLFVGAFVFFPAWFIFQFSQNLKKGLRADDTGAAEEAFLNLRRFYQFVGILLIIALAIYAIAFLFGILMLGRTM